VRNRLRQHASLTDSMMHMSENVIASIVRLPNGRQILCSAQQGGGGVIGSQWLYEYELRPTARLNQPLHHRVVTVQIVAHHHHLCRVLETVIGHAVSRNIVHRCCCYSCMYNQSYALSECTFACIALLLRGEVCFLMFNNASLLLLSFSLTSIFFGLVQYGGGTSKTSYSADVLLVI